MMRGGVGVFQPGSHGRDIRVTGYHLGEGLRGGWWEVETEGGPSVQGLWHRGLF